MRLTRIDCVQENTGDGGYRHTIFDISKVNGERQINIISSVKFDEILSPHWLRVFSQNPELFLKEINDDEDTQSDYNPDDSGGNMG